MPSITLTSTAQLNVSTSILYTPTSDVTVGLWTTDAGASTGRFSRINEVPATDATFDQSSVTPTVDTMVVGLPTVTPGQKLTLHVRYSADTADQPVNLNVDLMQNSTTILQSWQINSLATGWTQSDLAVTVPITNGTNLSIRLNGTVPRVILDPVELL